MDAVGGSPAVTADERAPGRGTARPGVSAARAAGLEGADESVLAAVRRCPLGLPGAGAIAHLCGVAEGAVRESLDRLVASGYLASETHRLPCVPVDSTETVYRPGPAWLDLWPDVLANLPALPRRSPIPDPELAKGRLPMRFWHMFWNGAPSELRLPADANHIAIRLICSRRTTLAIQAWALCNLPTDALLAAAAGRNPPDAPTRSAILNMVSARRAGAVAEPV